MPKEGIFDIEDAMKKKSMKVMISVVVIMYI